MMAKQTFTVDVPQGFRLVLAFEPEGQSVPHGEALGKAAPQATEPEESSDSVPRVAHACARVKAVPPMGKYAPVEIEIDGKPVQVAACVNDVLWDIANGRRRVKFRPETLRKLRAAVPWVADALRRDHAAKVLSNRHTYNVPTDLLRLIDGGAVAAAESWSTEELKRRA